MSNAKTRLNVSKNHFLINPEIKEIRQGKQVRSKCSTGESKVVLCWLFPSTLQLSEVISRSQNLPRWRSGKRTTPLSGRCTTPGMPRWSSGWTTSRWPSRRSVPPRSIPPQSSREKGIISILKVFSLSPRNPVQVESR